MKLAIAIACITSLAFGLGACSVQGRIQSPEIQQLVKKSLHNMVFVKGGTFMMGNFGDELDKDGKPYLPYSWEQQDRPMHKVTLDSFSIGRYKVTYADFDVYMKAVGNLSYPDNPVLKKIRAATHPIGVSWQTAKNYCQWLGKQSGLPIDLPTEAQWEYAARSGGKMVLFATDNGNLDKDRNYPSDDTIDRLSPGLGVNQMGIYSIGKYPPNPLGLYDMGFDGADWVNDWFDPDYYAHSPEKNPQGPATGDGKVVRGWEDADYSALTFYRGTNAPSLDNDGGLFDYPSVTFRCAIQSPKPQ